LKFDVASLKPSPPGGRGGGIRPDPGGKTYRATNCSIKTMLTVAYRVKPEQIVGGPGWMENDLYDMIANAERQSSGDELHMMLLNLLKDRCQLKYHLETREMSAYVLSVDKGGAKLTPHQAQNGGDPWIEESSDLPFHIKMKATAVPMDYFAFRLAARMDRPVVDQTGIKGGYDFDLAYTRELPPGIPENAMINGAPIDTSGPTIYEAVRQQLGLRLDAKKAPAQVMVIDHVEKPTEN
jgi:uncharacterized protein (TIGR03435 family)